MTDLTKLQRQVLEAMIEYKEIHSKYPTIMNLLKYMNEEKGYDRSIPNSIIQVLRSLTKKGFIARGAYIIKTI